jgi:hypothetical protein
VAFVDLHLGPAVRARLDPSSLALARSLLDPGPSPSEAAEANELADRVTVRVQRDSV